jgi:purine-binding chemotaxis protein CheW
MNTSEQGPHGPSSNAAQRSFSMQPGLDPLQASGGALEYLSFKLGNEEYGVDIQKVQELRAYTAVTAIANAPPQFKGVVNLRGLIVPIIDLRIQFRLGEPSYDQFTVVIIMYVGQSQVGVVVDSVSDVITFKPEQLKPVPAMSAASSADYMVGVGAVDARMILLVDIDRLLAASALGSFEQYAELAA